MVLHQIRNSRSCTCSPAVPRACARQQSQTVHEVPHSLGGSAQLNAHDHVILSCGVGYPDVTDGVRSNRLFSFRTNCSVCAVMFDATAARWFRFFSWVTSPLMWRWTRRVTAALECDATPRCRLMASSDAPKIQMSTCYASNANPHSSSSVTYCLVDSL
jgi:hypothetical protein